jgi:hypothetical protein
VRQGKGPQLAKSLARTRDTLDLKEAKALLDELYA